MTAFTSKWKYEKLAVVVRVSQTTQNVVIVYLHKSHNTPLLTPQILRNRCWQFLLGHEDVPRKI